MDPVLPVFLSIAVQEQVGELRSYLKSNGADLEDEGPENLSENLSEIFSVCSETMKSCSETDMEGFLNSLISLMFAMTEKRDDVICAFVKCLVEMENQATLRHRVLSVLFCGLNTLDPTRYDVYCGQLELASKSGLLDMVVTDLEQVKPWLNQWNDVEKSRKVYRLLHDAFIANEQSEKGSEMMIELLRTHPEDGTAKEDATNCIVSFIDRPNVWIMDHLLDLGPVKSLKGELIYQMLEIFVSGNIKEYTKFYEENSNFVASTGLNHERNLRKIRILTFISLVNKRDEITFEELSKELNLNVDDVESFIIDVLKTRLARVRIDGVEERVITSSAAHRTFGNAQWQILQQRLKEWQTNLQTVEKQLLDIQPM